MMNDMTIKPTRNAALTAAQLKMLAMGLMVIDHIGAFLLMPDSALYPICRAVGRLAFPIFCFLLAEGARHTRSLPRYMARLAAFALISTPPCNWVHSSVWYSLEQPNVFFTLLLGLAAIFCVQSAAPQLFRKAGQARLADNQTACALLGAPFCVLLYWAAYALHTDYGGYGVAAILIFYFLRERPVAAWSIFALLSFVCYDWAFVRYGTLGITDYAAMNPYAMLSHRVWQDGYKVIFVNARQAAAPLAVFPCAAYNGQRGALLPPQSPPAKYEKYLFYAFYPVHLMVIAGVQTLMAR